MEEDDCAVVGGFKREEAGGDGEVLVFSHSGPGGRRRSLAKHPRRAAENPEEGDLERSGLGSAYYSWEGRE